MNIWDTNTLCAMLYQTVIGLHFLLNAFLEQYIVCAKWGIYTLSERVTTYQVWNQLP